MKPQNEQHNARASFFVCSSLGLSSHDVKTGMADRANSLAQRTPPYCNTSPATLHELCCLVPRTALPERFKARAATEIRAGSEQVAIAILPHNKIELKHPRPKFNDLTELGRPLTFSQQPPCIATNLQTRPRRPVCRIRICRDSIDKGVHA